MSDTPAVRSSDGRGGSIYDLGYRGYEGPRLGRRSAIGALLTHSLRTAYGLGRSTRSKVAPVGITLMATLPALAAIAILVLISQFGPTGDALEAVSPIKYATLFPFTASLVFFFSASQAPELFGRDQQTGVLPLYFSRAISRLDYAAARFLGLSAALIVLALTPQLSLMIGRVLVAPDLVDGLTEEVVSLPAIMVVGLATVAVVGSISAAIAALVPRRLHSTIAIFAVFFIPTVVAGLLVELETGALGAIAVLLSPGDVLDGINAMLFGTEPDNPSVRIARLQDWMLVGAAAAWMGASLTALVVHYRRLQP